MTTHLPATENGEPILRVRSSGHGGHGYSIPTEWVDGKPRNVPGVTTITNNARQPGIEQWSVDQTAAFAVANVDAILNRTEEQGYGFLRYRWKNEPKLDADPNLRNWHGYVLNDAADLGTWGHTWIEADLLGEFGPEITEFWQEEIAEQWEIFKFEHDIRPILVEQIVYNPIGYAGTLDFIVELDGEIWLLDGKSSRKIMPAHRMQLSALGAAPVWLKRVPEGTPEASKYVRKNKPDTWWVEDVLPSFTRYGFLNFRPTDDDGTPAFCKIKTYDTTEDGRLLDAEAEQVSRDAHYDWFLGYLTAKHAERSVAHNRKQATKEEGSGKA